MGTADSDAVVGAVHEGNKNMMTIDDDKQKEYWEENHGHRMYDHPVVEFFARQRIEQVAGKWLDLSTIKTALDVGCGDGFSTYYMNQHVEEVHAIDRSNRMLNRHPLRDTGRCVQGDVRELPFEDNTFDLVYGWEILHHISNPHVVLAEMARVTRKYVLIAEPNRYNIFQFGFALADPEHRWVLRYSLKYMRKQFELAGLNPEQTRAGGWIFPNKAPVWLLPILKIIPYWCPLGISNWVLGTKNNGK